MKKRKLVAGGVTSGIGSMLLGAKLAGFDVTFNVEHRKYYHWEDTEGRNTFLKNFPGATMTEDYENPPAHAFGVDLILLHTECGHASNLNSNKSSVHGCSDIPKAFELVNKLRPRFFVSDNLPKSLIGFPMSEYARMLPDYDLFPEWLSNWGYGNVQKQRKRFFMIGALKSEGFTFHPGEQKHDFVVKNVIGDLLKNEGKFVNHERHASDALCAKGYHLKYRGHRATWGEMRDYVLNEMKEGAPILYHGEGGQLLTRVGSYKGHWDGPAHVLTGGISGFHPIKGFPYTIRERARIQGFPDSFIFYGTVLDAKGRWNHDKNMHMVKQTGKAMPIQFNQYISEQIKAHIEGRPWKCSETRLLPPDPYIDQTKTWWCKEGGGYGKNQLKACEACWMNARCPMSLTLSLETRKEIEDGFKDPPRQRMEKGQQKSPRVRQTDPRRRLRTEPKVVNYNEAFEKPLRNF